MIADRAPESKVTQHFFVADYKKGDNITYMLWKEARKLWIMPLGDESKESWLSVRYPSGGQFIDLDKDVVSTEKEVGTSTYLVSQAWVVQRVYEAVINGKPIEIESKKQRN